MSGTMDQATPEELDEMRLSGECRGWGTRDEAAAMSDEAVVAAVDRNWPGGAAQYRRDLAGDSYAAREA